MNFFTEISVLIVTTAFVAGIMRVLKQPIIIGYILTGLILGPQFLNVFNSPETLEIFSQMGITILLFIVGLHLSPKELASFGKSAFVIGILQVILTSFFGFFISILLGFGTVDALYIGAALSFSSTIIVLKILSDKKDLEKLYGRLCIGILLLQDIVAAVALVLSASFSGENVGFYGFMILILKGILISLIVAFCALYVLPKIGNFFAQSQESLFLFSLAWGFGISAVFGFLGFSVEMGALIAGVSLSMSTYSQEISAKLKPLRDFFVVVFFIALGSHISFKNFETLVYPLLIFSAFVLVFKPFIITSLIGAFRYTKKTAFFGGVSLAQISEFSLVLTLLGVKVGHVGNDTLSLITLLSLVSILSSTYLTIYVEKLYPVFAPYLKVFERKRTIKETDTIFNFDVILFGCNRMGYDFIREFRHLGPAFLAVDFDPDVIGTLQKEGINCKYGDAEDSEFLDEIEVAKAKLVISTIPDFDTNQYLISKIRKVSDVTSVIAVSYDIDQAIKLYDLGATYVALPHFIGGEYVAKYAKGLNNEPLDYKDKRQKHIEYLNERRQKGHSHPIWNHHY